MTKDECVLTFAYKCKLIVRIVLVNMELDASKDDNNGFILTENQSIESNHYYC